MDLASLESVEDFAADFIRQLQGQPLHVLVNNAGSVPQQEQTSNNPRSK